MRAASPVSPEQDLFLDAVELNLYNFNSGLERIFKQIASVVDRSVPDGHGWHRELVRQMSADVPDLRPSVISSATAKDIDFCLDFRHGVPKIFYPNLMTPGLRRMFQMVRRELIAFGEFLAGLARDD